MIDRELVGDYHVKPKKDREHEAEEKEEMNFYGGDNAASRTPLPRDTPIVKMGGGASIYGKSSYYGGGGMSPSFGTPIYKYSQREFSERQMDDLPANSPLPSQTPLNFNPSSTPLGGYSGMSPLYNVGQTSYHNSSLNRPSSQIRSPSYIYQNSGSSSPNYSSLQSRSPDYNSPGASSGRYGNSPNYSPSPMDQHRNPYKKEEEIDSEEDDE
jgi:hypothetical protein